MRGRAAWLCQRDSLSLCRHVYDVHRFERILSYDCGVPGATRPFTSSHSVNIPPQIIQELETDRALFTICRSFTGMFRSAVIPTASKRSEILNFLATTCVFSEGVKPRPHGSFTGLVSNNTLVLSAETLLDVNRGILRVRESDPDKAKRLRGWLAEAKDQWPFLEGRESQKAKILAAMLECKELKPIWLPQAKSTHPGFGYHVAIAAAAIAYDLPIAGYGLRPYAVIDRYFELPGLFDARTEAWFGTTRKEVDSK